MTGKIKILVTSIKVLKGEVKDWFAFQGVLLSKNQLNTIRHFQKHQIGQISQRSNISVFPIRDIVFGKSQFRIK